ncbi:MAG: hypothetical protein E7081_09740 [Bacteroidales bacterium]|nr:hypothetical protein [Bacteroidales bacterium]
MEPIRFKILYKTETPMQIASELLLLLPSNILISLEFAEFCTLAKNAMERNVFIIGNGLDLDLNLNWMTSLVYSILQRY